jgi:hypothetical protein
MTYLGVSLFVVGDVGLCYKFSVGLILRALEHVVKFLYEPIWSRGFMMWPVLNDLLYFMCCYVICEALYW